jgi:hypothetical protein
MLVRQEIDMSDPVTSRPAVVISRCEKIRLEEQQLSPSRRFYHTLTSHPVYQDEFGGKKLTRRETRLMDLGAMTAADMSFSAQGERAQSAFKQLWQFLSLTRSTGEDSKEISWVSKYMTLRTILPVAVVIIGGLFTFLTWTVEHNAAEKRELYQILSDTRQDLSRVSGLPEKLIKDIDELTKEASTLQGAKDELVAEVSSLKQRLTDSQTQVAALKKQNDELQQQLTHAQDDKTATSSGNPVAGK